MLNTQTRTSSLAMWTQTTNQRRQQRQRIDDDEQTVCACLHYECWYIAGLLNLVVAAALTVMAGSAGKLTARRGM